MSFPVLTNSGGQIGTGLLYSNVVYFPTIPGSSGGRVVSWTVPPGITTCRVRVWGGGGAGYSIGSISGGGGGFALETVTVTPGDTVTVTLGTGGTGGNTPGTGGTSSFGAYVSATGGRNTPTTGGAGSGGDINMNGAAGVSVIGGNAGNLFIPFTGVSGTEILTGSSQGALTLMGTPTNPLDKIGTGYLFGVPSTSVLGYNVSSLTSLPTPATTTFGNGAGGTNSVVAGTYPGGGGSYTSNGNGAGGLVIVEY